MHSSYIDPICLVLAVAVVFLAYSSVPPIPCLLSSLNQSLRHAFFCDGYKYIIQPVHFPLERAMVVSTLTLNIPCPCSKWQIKTSLICFMTFYFWYFTKENLKVKSTHILLELLQTVNGKLMKLYAV